MINTGLNQNQKRYWLTLMVIFSVLGFAGSVGAIGTVKPEPAKRRDFRLEMRNLVRAISLYAKTRQAAFIVIPQNGHELLTDSGLPSGKPVMWYLNALDGIGQESLFYGFDKDDAPTPEPVTSDTAGLLDVAKDAGLPVLVTDYCSTPAYVDASYRKNRKRGYISYAADSQNLDRIAGRPPSPYQANTADITSPTGAKNFLYLIDPGKYDTKASFLQAVRDTDYDMVIMDLFFHETEPFSPEDIATLKIKSNGGRRLVIAYMSIGEAEEYRYYWKPAWKPGYPPWMAEENRNWPGNFKVRYWEPAWQKILFGNPGAYLDRILAAGFDGVYLDIIDAFEYFESLQEAAAERTERPK